MVFGVKGAYLFELTAYNYWIPSADSLAYDFGARVKARERGVSNTLTHRSAEMTRWMQTAAGDQFRLALAD